MQIETKYFGVKEVDEKEFINFPHGIPGFENINQYIIMQYGEDSQFLIMQATQKKDLAFILIRLEQIVPNYSIDLPDEVVAEIQLKKPENAAMYAVVSIPGELIDATVNLAAPLLINTQAKLGKQIILNNPQYAIRYPLFAPADKEDKIKAAK